MPATHNQPSALDLLITKLCFSNSHLLWEKNYKPLNVWRCWDVHRGAHMSHFVRASGEGLPVSEDTGGEAPVLRLRKSEGEKREWGSTPPHQSFSLQRCLVIFIYWDDFARNPVAWLCPPTLWYVAWFLAGCPQRKRGSRVQPKTPPEVKNMAHRVHLETPHTIPYTLTHKHHTRWCTGRVGGEEVHQALIIIKGPMICFLLHFEEHGSHLNEYQINALKLLQHSPDCCVQFVHCNKQRLRDYRFICAYRRQRTQILPQGSFLILKSPNTK